jgi:hypothetical protein
MNFRIVVLNLLLALGFLTALVLALYLFDVFDGPARYGAMLVDIDLGERS